MRNKGELFVLLFVLLFFVSAAYAQWATIGPGGGGAMYNPAVSPLDSNTMAVSCDMGGYYVTTNAGVSWKMLDMNSQVTFTVFHPTDQNTFYCGSDYVYRTTDKGTTWAPFTDGGDQGYENPLLMAIDPDDPNFMCLANGSRQVLDDNYLDNFKYTTNGGTTWSTSSGLPSSSWIKSIFIDKDGSTSTKNIYVATSGGFYRSTNNGVSFSAANTGLPSTDLWDMAGGCSGGATTLYVSVNDDPDENDPNGIYKSTNGGTSWAKVSAFTTFSDTDYTHDIEVPLSNPNVVYVQTGAEIYKTINGGTSWSLIMEEPGDNVTDSWQKVYAGGNGGFGFGWAFDMDQHSSLGTSATDANIIFWTDDGRLVRSTNGGTAWTQLYSKVNGNGTYTSVGLEDTTTYEVRFDPSNANNVYISYTDIGFWKSTDGGTSWVYCNTGHHNTYGFEIDPANGNRIWATWGNTHDIPEATVIASAPNDAGGMVTTSNGGSSWSAVGGGLPTTTLTYVLVDPTSNASSRTMYVCAFGKGVYKSTNGGTSWALKNTGITGSLNAWRMHRDSSNGDLYLVVTRNSGTAGALYKSVDDAETWTKINNSQNFPYILDVAICPNDSQTIYMCGYTYNSVEGGVYKTTNGGTTWARVLDNGYIYGLTVDERDPNLVYAGSCEDSDIPMYTGVYKSTNKGTSWSQVSNFPFRACREVSLHPNDIDKMYVTTFGGGVIMSAAVVVPKYTISGYIKDDSSTSFQGVTVTLSGGASSATVTNGLGYYEFSNISSGTYVVTPSKTDWGFSPSAKNYTNLAASYSSQDYTGVYTGVTYGISGTVTETGSPLSGVTVTLSGTASKVFTTSADGTYAFTKLLTGNYTVRPAKSGYTFSPVNYTYTGLSSTQAAQNFAGTSGAAATYIISGYVKDLLTTDGIGGVTVTLSGAESDVYSTIGDGYYQFSGLAAGAYTVTPTKSAYTFTPTSIINATLSSDTTGQNFSGVVGSVYTISGYIKDSMNVGISGVSVALTGTLSGNKTTGSDGYFEFTGLPAGSYTIVPGKENWEFDPTSKSLTGISSDQIGQDFTGMYKGSAGFSVRNNIMNPLKGGKVTLTYNIQTAGYVSLDIYNLNGVLIKSIIERSYMGSGSGSVEWDGTDKSGTIVSSGIYIARLKQSGSVVTRKICVVK